MKDRSPDPRRLEVGAFARHAGRLGGELPQAALPRLAGSLLHLPGDAAAPAVVWQAQGELRPVVGGEPEIWLRLQARTAVMLQCQRCLQPMTQALSVDGSFQFVRGEDEAERLDEECEHDVLALPPRLDLLALLEDELILALPIVPRHDLCPQPLPLPQDELPATADAAPHPFAALAALRGPKPS